MKIYQYMINCGKKMNWHLSRALKMSRYRCGQDSVGPFLAYLNGNGKAEAKYQSLESISLKMKLSRKNLIKNYETSTSTW